jgi:hypothetical protein
VAPDDDPAFLRDLAEQLDNKDADSSKNTTDEDKPEDKPEDEPEEDSGPSPEPKDKS